MDALDLQFWAWEVNINVQHLVIPRDSLQGSGAEVR